MIKCPLKKRDKKMRFPGKKIKNKVITILARTSPGIVAVVLFLLTGYASEILIFDRDAIAAGQIWRLVTGHFVHCDSEHLLLNLLGIWGLIFIFDRLSAKAIWLWLAAGIIMVDAWIWFRMPELNLYCGLSGIENSLLAAGLISVWNSSQQKLAVIAAVLSMGKIIYEIYTNTPLFSHISWASVPEVHGAGFAAGVLLPAFICFKNPLNRNFLWLK